MTIGSTRPYRRMWHAGVHASLLVASVVSLALCGMALANPDGTALAAEPASSSTAAPTAALDPALLPSAADLDAYLAGKGSPMAGQGAAFVASGARWGVDPRLLIAISGAESSFGSITCAPFNAWGWGCPNGPYEFTSWADENETVTSGLRRNYLAEGRTTVAGIHSKYAPIGAANDPTGLNNNWTINTSRFLIEMGGDPADVDLDGVAGTYPVGVGGALPIAGSSYDAAAPDAPAEDKKPAPTATVPAGGRAPIKIMVKNTGTAAWDGSSVRLRRVDAEDGILTAPIAALDAGEEVPSNGTATFTVQATAVSGATGTIRTRWQLEGPTGPVGDEIDAPVAIATSAYAYEEGAVSAPPSLAEGEEGTFIATFRNAGTETWHRGGDDRVFAMATQKFEQPDAEGKGGDMDSAPLLERTVAPGEFGTFVWKMASTGSGSVEFSVGPTQLQTPLQGEPVRFPVEVG